MIILLKLVISTSIVLSLVFITERNAKLGGLITGLPLGTGIMIFFYGLEQGVDFVMKAIPYGISGMVSTIGFGIGFYLSGQIFKNSVYFRVLFSFIGGLFTYLLSSFALSLFEINLQIASVIFITGFILAQIFYSNIKTRQKIQVKKFTIYILLFRIAFVVLIVLTITGLARMIGPKWSGLIASFPTILSPLLIILSFTYKDNVYPNLLKHLAYSISTIFLFYFLIMWFFPLFGIVYGILLAYSICVFQILILNKFNFYRKPNNN